MNLIKRNGVAIIITAVLAVMLYVAIVFVMDNMIGRTKLTLGDGVYSAKLATNRDERDTGLGGLGSLGESRALVMAFPEDGLWGVWMKDMKFPIDIIWLDSAKKVIHIEQEISPDIGTSRTFYPRSPARYVVELPSGSVKLKSIKLKQTANFDVGDRSIE